MNLETKKSLALEIFKATYPSVTSADLQTFVLGMKAMEEIMLNCSYSAPEAMVTTPQEDEDNWENGKFELNGDMAQQFNDSFDDNSPNGED